MPYAATALGGSSSSICNAMLGPFEIDEVVGQGGMGIVFSGFHVRQGVPVAIKVITREGAQHPVFRTALQNEVRAVATLNHPGIVRVLDYGKIDQSAEELTEGELKAGSPYFVMEYLPSGTLSNVVGKVTWKQTKAILLTLLDALAHAHASDVIHRDIKPGNILFSQIGGRVVPKLADFGLAIGNEGKSFARRSVGTPHYMAPEQYEQPWRNHGPWSDLYSLGCVAFELICGRRLVSGRTARELLTAHVEGKRRSLKTILRLPDGFETWLEKMLRPDYAERYQSAADAARDLMKLDDSELADMRPPEATELAIGGITPVLDVYRTNETVRDRAPTFQRTWSHISPAIDDELIPDTWESARYERTPMKLVGAGLGLFGLRRIPLVGRSDELNVLWKALRDVARNESPKIVIVSSNEGAGKTRLGQWFVRRVRELGVGEVLSATHTPENGRADGIPRMMARHFRTLGATRAEASMVVRDELAKLDIDDPYKQNALSTLAADGMEQPEVESDGFSFSSPKQRYAVLHEYLKDLSRERPAVLWLDDCHFGLDTLGFVEHLVSNSMGADCASLIVISVTDELIASRTDESAAIDKLKQYAITETVKLRALSSAQHEEMINEVAHLEADLALELGERTAGNPRMAIELIGDWVARGLLEVSQNGFVLRDGARAVIPDSLHQVWEQRISEIIEVHGGEAQISLEIAAALGHEVDFGEWRAACRIARIDFDSELLATLLDRRLANRTETGWTFAHPQLKESLEKLARENDRWRKHKLRCAYLVEMNFDTGLPAYAERHGRYLVEAEEFERSLEPLRIGAKGRRAQGEYRESQQLVSSYLRALEKLRIPADDPRWGFAWAYRARVHVNAGDPKSAYRWGDRAQRAAEEHGWTAVEVEAGAWLAAAKHWLGESDSKQAVETAYQKLQAYEGNANSAVYGFLAYLLTSMRRFDEARQLLDRVLTEIPDQTERDLALNHHHRCRLAIYEEDWGTAIDHGERALEIFERLGHFPAVASCLEYLAEVHRLSGETEQAVELYTSCVELQRTIGFPAAIAQINLASILLEEADFAGAEKLYTLSLDTLRAMGRRRAEVTTTAGILAAACGLERWSAVAELLDDVEEFFEAGMEREPDIGRLLRKAGELSAGPQPALAQKAYELAVRQYELLDDDSTVSELEELIGSLGLFPERP